MTNPESYTPVPIPTADVALPRELDELIERLAAHVHDLWALKRMREGWRYGPCRSDTARTHPDLVPYSELPLAEQDYDRTTARGTLCAILALGYCIVPATSP
jgi:hypothetical protein